MLTFKASADEGDIQLSWTTALEFNSTGFTVERSLNGKTFDGIGFVKRNGLATDITSYKMRDKDAFGKTNVNILYYRLRQNDIDDV